MPAGQSRRPTLQRRALTQIAQEALEPYLHAGGLAVDATAGNGHDTLFLAEAVGASGHVWAFDVQHRAILGTRDRLRAHGAERQVSLIHASHADLASHLPASAWARLDVVMLNLGYLPGGERRIATRPDTTLAALRSALNLLRPTGVVSVVVYRGHPGGQLEHETIQRWLRDGSVAWRRIESPVPSPTAPLLYQLSPRSA